MPEGATLNSLNLWLVVTWPGHCTWLHTFGVRLLVQPVSAVSSVWTLGSGLGVMKWAEEVSALVLSPL